MPFENVEFRFPPMCVGCTGTEDLGFSRLSSSYVRAGYRYHISCKVPLCARCEVSARQERKIVLIGGLVCLGVGIVCLALANLLISLIDYGFIVILFTSFIACFGFFDRAYHLRDLGNKYAMLRGVRRDKTTQTWKPKIRFKNATFRGAYDEINSADVTIGQIAKYIQPTKPVSSYPVAMPNPPATMESPITKRTCPVCAAELPITAKFCNKCGLKF